jgi:hypothetical protein
VREMAGDVGACDAAGGARGWSEGPPPLDTDTEANIERGVARGERGDCGDSSVP